MALDLAPNAPQPYDAPVKDLYEIGEMPPMGHVPAKMYAWTIRRERHGEPDTAMQVEVVEPGTVVGKGPDGQEFVVTDESAVFNGPRMWVTAKVYDLLKAKSQAARP